MRLDRPLALAAALLVGCASEVEQPTTSRVQRVKAKSGEVWGRDLANALGLNELELCQELGEIDCIQDAHLIVLGGMEPEVLGINAPLENAAVSAPIAVDRVATAACAERYRLDKENADTAVVFGPLFSGNVASYNSRLEVSRTLVRRVLARHPTESDEAAIIGLYDALEPVSTNLESDWAVGACLMLATSTEALFY